MTATMSKVVMLGTMVACACAAALAGGTKVSTLAKEKVVIVPAHPDDLISTIGFCLLARDTFEVHVVDFTHGERGLGLEGFTNGVAKATRIKEEESVCAAVGATLHWLDEVDGDAYACRETCWRLADLLKELRPRAVFGHWPVDIHGDHMMAGATLMRRSFLPRSRQSSTSSKKSTSPRLLCPTIISTSAAYTNASTRSCACTSASTVMAA